MISAFSLFSGNSVIFSFLEAEMMLAEF